MPPRDSSPGPSARPATAPRPRKLPKPLRVVRYHVRLFVALAVGLMFVLMLPDSWRISTRLLSGWDLFAFVYLVLAFFIIPRFDSKGIRQRADEQDEGGFLLLVLTVAAAVFSLGGVVAELGAVHGSSQNNQRLAFLLAAVTAVLSWSLIHTIFAFNYAHRFYRGPDERGVGLAFPLDDHPNYWDFVYFSFVIGMTFQVSDVQVTTTGMRRIVVTHGIVSFIFSVAILALTVNIGASLI